MAKLRFDRPPDMQIDPAKRYSATIETSHGTVKADLFAAQAPKTVNNFVFLARQGFYEDVGFHRVIKGFVIQGGDPEGTGRGGPGYEFEDELDNDLRYEHGTLAMANAGPNTNGSQFFIVAGPQGESLPKNYTIFGKVGEGLEVVETVGAVPTSFGDRPREPVSITRITIEES